MQLVQTELELQWVQFVIREAQETHWEELIANKSEVQVRQVLQLEHVEHWVVSF